MADKTPLLIPGKTHPHALARLQEHFDVRCTPAESPVDLPNNELAKITSLATFLSPVDRNIINALPALEIVSSFGVGYDHVDADLAASRGIVVTHTPDVLNDEVADTTIGLLLNTVRQLPRAETWLRDGHWQSKGSFELSPLSLRGRTIGIYGLGRIGRTIAKRLSGFDVPIHYHSRRPVDGVDFQYHDTLVSLAATVDILINIVPSTTQTIGSVNAEVLGALGEKGVFINVGRGNTVDEPALIEALQAGTIAAAGLDVFEDEPNVPQALLEIKTAVLLPHVASASVDTRQMMADLVVDNLLEWKAGRPALTSVPETTSNNKRD